MHGKPPLTDGELKNNYEMMATTKTVHEFLRSSENAITRNNIVWIIILLTYKL